MHIKCILSAKYILFSVKRGETVINLGLIWDNVFEYIKDKYGLLTKIDSKQKLQIYGSFYEKGGN